MSDESRSDYHSRRAREEAEQAARCRDRQARSLHKTLGAMHSERAAACGPAATVPELVASA